MSKRDERILMALVGAGLMVYGHKIMDAELGELGVPHAVGGLLVALAIRG
jgi:hypothetical protein